jgi:hypothetical protein
VGSGLPASNVRAYCGAHAFFVGTTLKHNWANVVTHDDHDLCAHQFIDACS